jgi:hypothetical protein
VKAILRPHTINTLQPGMQMNFPPPGKPREDATSVFSARAVTALPFDGMGSWPMMEHLS